MRGSVLLVVTAVACSPGTSPRLPVPQPRLQVQPERVDFLRIVEPASRQLKIRNVGDPGTELVLEPPRLESADFTVSDSLVVTATAATPGFKAAELVLVSNGGTVRVPLGADVVPLEPCVFLVSPAQLDFGLVTAPAIKSANVTVRSSGAGACFISDVEIVGSSVFSVPAAQLPLQLLPGQERLLRVDATPGAAGQHKATLRIGPHQVRLVATVPGACLTISPSDLDFGTVQQRCPSPRRTFAIYNTCVAPVTVASYGLLAAGGVQPGTPSCPGPTPCPEFFIDGTPSFEAGTQFVAGAAPHTFALRYKPLDVGPDTGAFLLRVLQNGETVDYVVTVRGTGDVYVQQTDSYLVGRRPAVNLLLVLDDGPAMAGLRSSVTQNLEAFADYWFGGAFDTRIGVTTSSGDGGLLGPVISDRTPNARALFAQQLALIGVNGTATPPLLEIAVAASSAMARDGGHLGVISVSASDDASPAPVQTYTAQLDSFSTVGPELDGGQPRARAAATELNGVIEDIHTPNWHFAFRSNIGLPRSPWTFHLTAEPASAPVVSVDGVPAPAGSWSFNSVMNAIVFQPFSIPEGSTVTVTYDVTCL
mgnify:CR=1 FL=1